VAHRAGHALHTAFAKRILDERDAWKVVELVPEQAAAFVPAAVPVNAG
jgi:UDP-3-O-acyl-N-acetylglucosamine deacetylase